MKKQNKWELHKNWEALQKRTEASEAKKNAQPSLKIVQKQSKRKRNFRKMIHRIQHFLNSKS